VVEALAALGADAVFGLPGIHALPIWEGLRESELRTYGMRTELNAAFAAAGWAHVTGRPAPLVLSTGPGALNSLTALMEAASSHLPVVAISSQIPSDLIGKGRGFLHELRDQRASFAPIVKWAGRANTAAEIPEIVFQAWRHALTAPSGPTYIEVPYDLLKGAAAEAEIGTFDGTAPEAAVPSAERVAEAARLLSEARTPVLWAGGGVIRSGAWDEIAELAARLDAPVATTYMGKGAFPEDHPLSAGSGADEAAFQELVGDADVLLAVGTELGAETTGQYTLRFAGRVIQIDATPERIGATYEATPLIGDARATLRALLALLAKVEARPAHDGVDRAKAVRERIARGLGTQDRALERGLVDTIRAALPRDAVTTWDMTILGYWAAAHFKAYSPRRFLYPLGSGTLGFAWPAALGAKAALRGTPVLAVCGDGGFMYGISELASARQHGLAARLLIVDDGGYGILREYQRDAFEANHGVDLAQPDFVSLVAAFGVPVRSTSADRLGADLEWAFAVDGPSVLVLRERLATWLPTV
jgi:acetolactate synthase-1/2/3 large subunit